MWIQKPTLRGCRIRNSVELLCGCCLWANTDGLPICHTDNTPQSLGHRVCLCFTVSMHGHISMCSHARVCLSLSVTLRKQSCTSPLSSSALFEKSARSCLTFVLRPKSSRLLDHDRLKHKELLVCGWGRYLIMWVTDQSGVDSQEDSEGGWTGEEGDRREWKREKWGKNKRQGLLSSPYHLSSVAFSWSVPFSLPCRSEKIHCVLCIRGLWMIQVVQVWKAQKKFGNCISILETSWLVM